MEHKEIVLPEIDLSHDEGDPRWHEHGETTPLRNKQGEIYAYEWNGLPLGHYREYFELCIRDAWEKTVLLYEDNPDDTFAAYWYLCGHPVFWKFRTVHEGYPVNHVSNLEHDSAWLRGCIHVTPHKVSPVTRRIEDDDTLNTKTEWWYEFGPQDLLPQETPHGPEQARWHDYLLDDGADTYEQAVIDIALKVHTHYGNDRRVVDTDEWRNGERAYGSLLLKGGEVPGRVQRVHAEVHESVVRPQASTGDRAARWRVCQVRKYRES